ncbi:MAG: DNA-3-methyladenine glycosylase [Anaerolineae bacterium]
MTRWSRDFFARDTLTVARELLGARLVRHWNGHRLSGLIVECEAYIGQTDTACHASRGRTRRNEVMFGPPGHAYVYFTYGMHWMLNVVTEPEGFPAAILIRALQPDEGIEVMRKLRSRRRPITSDVLLTSGPARLTQALAIDGSLNGLDMVEGDILWLESGMRVSPEQIASGPRIGIAYAHERDRAAPWRFWIDGNPFVSR